MLKYFCFWPENKFMKKKQLLFGMRKVNERLNVKYILQKLVEVDKLKMLLLSYNQIKIFEYVHKPVIKNNLDEQVKHLAR